MIKMKDELKKIIYMGLGAMSLTSEKASELKDELVKKGEDLVEKGKIENEELKRNIMSTIKENVTVINKDLSVEEISEQIDALSPEEKEVLRKKLSKKGK